MAQARSQWCDYDEVCKHVLEQGGSISVVGRREHGGAGCARGDDARWHRVLLPHRSSLRSPRLHACAPPTLSALSAPASRARTLAPSAPPPSVAEGVEPTHIDTTSTNANTAPHAWPSVEDIRKCTNTIMAHGTKRCSLGIYGNNEFEVFT
ncbi:hypothetical protein B0H14DRAFT_3878697 [Mycena olivaceomarginata]|nr:hypothetical protein B0H14DRAFT_3878697 [Mycena olivaceomarginata]